MDRNEQTELLREMRDILRVMAEPALAQRDGRLRASLLKTVGKSKAKARAVLLMDGSRTQTAIRKECGIDQGDLSRLVKSLRAEALIAADEKHPKLTLPVPANLFENTEKQNG